MSAKLTTPLVVEVAAAETATAPLETADVMVGASLAPVMVTVTVDVLEPPASVTV